MMTERGARKRLSRRDALRILAVGGGGAAVAWKLGLLGSRAQRLTRSRLLMGTEVRLQLIGPDREAAAAAADATLSEMSALEGLLSRHDAGSELSRLNANGRLDAASGPLLDVLRLADRVARLGDGAFDISVQPVLDLRRAGMSAAPPTAEAIEQALARVDHRSILIEGQSVSFSRPGMAVTLDGIGKGYIVDRGVAELKRRGFDNVFVEAGGDLVAGGERASGRPWRVGIRSPRSVMALQARFDARNRAVATSGDYMQFFAADFSEHHIVDPRSGHSAPELASATVIAPDAATADALATLTLVLGARRGRDLLESLPGCEGYFVSKRLEVTSTSNFVVS